MAITTPSAEEVRVDQLYGMKDGYWMVLDALDVDEPKTATDVADEIDMTNATVYRYLDVLDRTDLVESEEIMRNTGRNATGYTRPFETLTVEF